MIFFKNPSAVIPALLLMGLAAGWIRLSHKSGRDHGALRYPAVERARDAAPLGAARWLWILWALRVAAVFCLVVAVMRPQAGIEESRVESEGVDIILAIDLSGSMMAEDFTLRNQRVNRLEAVKSVVRDFVARRRNDRIGIVVFAGRGYVQCPLTLDYGMVLDFLKRLEIGRVEDGTAIGEGLAMSLSRLRRLDSPSKVVILLTDGVNNAGDTDPERAAQWAKEIGVKVYTIGAGSKGRVPFPVRDFFGNRVYQWAVIDLDEKLLTKIADQTGAKYFRAGNTDELARIYGEIDRLEKSKAQTPLYTDTREWFWPFAGVALLMIVVEKILSESRLRVLP